MNPYHLSWQSYAGLGFAVAAIYGISNYGFLDYRSLGLFILAVCLLLVDVVKYYGKRQ